jgi:hypothetical protein
LSAAIFNGDSNRTEFPRISETDQFQAIANGTVDVLTSEVAYNMVRDVFEVRFDD